VSRKPKKISSKTHSIRANPDYVTIQIAVKLHKVPKGFKPTHAMLESLIRRKAELSAGHWDGSRVVGAKEGPNPPGIELRIVSWANPDRARRYGQRTGPQDDAWGSLRRVLASRSIRFHFRVIR
jgi:hypothetical protein